MSSTEYNITISIKTVILYLQPYLITAMYEQTIMYMPYSLNDSCPLRSYCRWRITNEPPG
jgi:hypothetical protein